MATPFLHRSKKTLQWMNLLNQKETSRIFLCHAQRRLGNIHRRHVLVAAKHGKADRDTAGSGTHIQKFQILFRVIPKNPLN